MVALTGIEPVFKRNVSDEQPWRLRRCGPEAAAIARDEKNQCKFCG